MDFCCGSLKYSVLEVLLENIYGTGSPKDRVSLSLPYKSSGALLAMLPLWVSVLGATLAMFELDRAAGLAFLPYIIWVTIAAALNYRVVQLNPEVAPRDLSAD